MQTKNTACWLALSENNIFGILVIRPSEVRFFNSKAKTVYQLDEPLALFGGDLAALVRPRA